MFCHPTLHRKGAGIAWFHEKKKMTLPELLGRLPEFEANCTFIVTENHLIGIHRVAEYIRSDVSVHHTHQDLATIAGINECHLKQLFKIAYNSTLYNYLFEERVKFATLLLKDSHNTIEEIAIACGYLDVRYFRKLIRQFTKPDV